MKLNLEDFKDNKLMAFNQRFDTIAKCNDYLADLKWGEGFECPKCGHEICYHSYKKPHSRVCKQCRYNDSPTAYTLFHKVKFGLLNAFQLTYDLVNKKGGITAEGIAQKYKIRAETASLFISKFKTEVESNSSISMVDSLKLEEKAAKPTKSRVPLKSIMEGVY
jgi:predicted RNA-binding Zn-ribbon protein involved in translation (DUF1610 family)